MIYIYVFSCAFLTIDEQLLKSGVHLMLNQSWRDPSFIAFKELFFTVRFPFVLALLLYTSIPYQLLLSQLWQHRSLLVDFWPYHDLKRQTSKQKQINLPFLMKNNVLDHEKILRMTKDSSLFLEKIWNYNFLANEITVRCISIAKPVEIRKTSLARYK